MMTFSMLVTILAAAAAASAGLASRGAASPAAASGFDMESKITEERGQRSSLTARAVRIFERWLEPGFSPEPEKIFPRTRTPAIPPGLAPRSRPGLYSAVRPRHRLAATGFDSP